MSRYLLADESCDFGIVEALRAAGHDVRAVAEITRRAEDPDVLNLSRGGRRVLLTEDKDFGRLIYLESQATVGVVLVRYVAMARKAIQDAVVDLVARRWNELPGRFVVVEPALAARAAEIEQLDLILPDQDLPPAWKAVIEGLEKQGTRVERRSLPDAPARGDLAAARSPKFQPEADGSLQLIRQEGPLEAAEGIAAWLAAQGSLAGTVVIGSAPVLDRALKRFGLPATGARAAARENALLQILPLVLEIGWSPPDPQRVLELLTLPESVVPRAVGWRLARSLREWPAVGSDAWNAALEEGIASLPEEGRKRVRDRLGVIFSSPVRRGSSYPAGEIRRRLDLLDRWFRGRLETEEGDRAPWEAAVKQCAALRELVEQSGETSLPEALLDRFLEEALRGEPGLPALSAEAGLAAVGDPGGIAGPARRIVWWNFTDAAAPSLPRVPLSRDEIADLEASGIPWLGPGPRAECVSARFRRPLLQATEAIILVSPIRGEDGAEVHPHPLWDEILARLSEARRAGSLVHRTPRGGAAPPQRERAYRPRPGPRRDWTALPSLVLPPSKVSPSSLETLLGCSFRWALQYVARIRESDAAAVPEGNTLFGNLAHEILRRVLVSNPRSPKEAEERAAALFDAEAPRLAATLFLPGADAARARARDAIPAAAREIARIFARSGLKPASIEQERAGTAFGIALEGRADLVTAPPAVVDFKSSWAKYKRQALENGSALQLAAYSSRIVQIPISSRVSCSRSRSMTSSTLRRSCSE